jgi:hypothetical protein
MAAASCVVWLTVVGCNGTNLDRLGSEAVTQETTEEEEVEPAVEVTAAADEMDDGTGIGDARAEPTPGDDSPPPSDEGPESGSPAVPSGSPTQLIQPGDLVYLGAFRLPEGSNGSSWEYSGYAMTYYPEGDANGADDGFPGSIFALGHDHQQMVAEIGIPALVISTDKDASELNVAATLQPFHDITGGKFGYLEIPRAGLAYLPAQASQTGGKLYFTWGQHFQFERVPSHGWSELDLSAPQTAGLWYLGEGTNYALNDYLFEIPETRAAEHSPGLRLATGRFRDGTWSGLGPALFAIGPWTEGNPPPPGGKMENVTPLLLYGRPVSDSPEIDTSDGMRMVSYAEPDEWSGGAWLTAGEKSAVIFVGTKATGNSWYGFANGVVYPTSGDANEPVPEVPPWPYDDRGWWSEGIDGQIIFYNPDDLAAVARGDVESWVPQPYATLSIDDVLFDPGFEYERQKRYLVGAVCLDREGGILYVVERRADEEKSIIHAFRVGG